MWRVVRPVALPASLHAGHELAHNAVGTARERVLAQHDVPRPPTRGIRSRQVGHDQLRAEVVVL
jgi:hypothetical protein